MEGELKSHRKIRELEILRHYSPFGFEVKRYKRETLFSKAEKTWPPVGGQEFVRSIWI